MDIPEFIMNHLLNIKNYLFYFLISLLLFILFLKTYIWFTPINEIELIKQGNTAVSFILAGTLLGYAINLAFAISYSYGPLQFFGYGVFSAILQLITFFIVE